MKDRGKAAVVETTYYGDMPCMKHPSSSSIGICSYCLKERLENLLCSACGEQRLSSCSCFVEVGSVGRISFLLENDEKVVDDKQEQVILLRSSSKCVDIKKNDQHGFWKLKRLFRKKKDKCCNEVDEKSDIIVSRSRSLCSFRNVETDDGGSDYRFSSAKISDVTTGGLFFDSDHEPRKSTENGYDFKNLRKRLQVKESDFCSNMDDSAFIDLKVDLSSSSQEKKLEFSGHRLSNMSDYGYDSAASMGNLRSGSCRIKEYDRRMKRGNKVWKWIFRQTSSVGRKSISKSDEINSNLIIKS